MKRLELGDDYQSSDTEESNPSEENEESYDDESSGPEDLGSGLGVKITKKGSNEVQIIDEEGKGIVDE